MVELIPYVRSAGGERAAVSVGKGYDVIWYDMRWCDVI